MKKNVYSPFAGCVFRTPLYPVRGNTDSMDFLDDDCFMEAVWLASPDLYQEVIKSKGINTSDLKLDVTLDKYLSRSLYRCTPFGLFAGCSVGEFGDELNIELVPRDKYMRCTRLDMNYVCALIQKIEADKLFRTKLKYYPNDSIYKIAGKLRYAEYFYKGTSRVHQLTNVEASDYIEAVLQKAKKGSTIEELALLLVDPEITIQEATDFINEVVDSQLLVSQIQPKVTGGDPLSEIISNLKSIDETELSSKLQAIKDLLLEIDSRPIGSSIYIYDKIIEVINSIGVPYEKKFLFQTDMVKPTINAVLPNTIIDEINDIIDFMSLFSEKSIKNANLDNFKNAYSERYEELEMPLFQVLDNELGLGYPVGNENTKDINPLIDDLLVGGVFIDDSRLPSISFSKLDSVLLKKYVDAISNNAQIIYLDREDFADTKGRIDNISDSITFMCHILKSDEGKPYLAVRSVGGMSGAYLLGRFCHTDSKIAELVNSITQIEQELNKDCIVAEIVHLPESRIGNIVHRPLIRNYEIHYLAQPGVDEEFRIGVEDLMVSVRKGRIILRSKKLNKEVLPMLTNAHNYGYNSMPVYNFLSEMQTQNKVEGVGFFWGEVFNVFNYLPEVRYGRHILSAAQWKIPQGEIKDFEKKNDDDLKIAFEELQAKHKFPDRVVISYGDNQLFLNLSSIKNIRTMLSLVKKHPIIVLEKALPEEDMFIVGPEGVFNNEFIIPLYKVQ